MRFILTGKCMCGASFNKDNELKDITNNESSEMSLRCFSCKALLRVSTSWFKEPETKSIAQVIDGKNSEVSQPKGRIYFDPKTLIHTFEDGSQAKLITRFEDCKPYQTKSLSTSSQKEVRYWKALV